jgi:NAD+ diphosphatase
LPQQIATSAVPFAGAGLDRAAHRRRDKAWLDQAFNSDAARVLVMREALPLVEGSIGQQGPRPVIWLGPQAAMLSQKAQRLFLGETAKGAPVFALELPSSFDLSSSPVAGIGVFEDFRLAAMGMSETDASAAVAARALFEWHRRHGFCSNCGTRTTVEEAGWKRKCDDCGAEHFPRVDPVAIMLAVVGDKCLLGRQAAWRPGFWSALAGFVEPGETIEQAAARELFEEAGVTAKGPARYLFGQPWPFPSSLMIGLILEAESEDLKVDTSELETARWFTRDEAAAMMAGTHPEFFAPPHIAVAHHIVKAWLEG